VKSEQIVSAALAGTAVFAVLSVLAAITNADALVVLAVVVDLVLFLAGCAAFLVTLARAAGRSRTEELTLPGIWWLAGSAPNEVRRRLLGAFGAEVVIGLATAFARPFTGLAFGVLAPVYGLGLAGLWAARLGTFPPRV
jgi:hypothetical protein